MSGGGDGGDLLMVLRLQHGVGARHLEAGRAGQRVVVVMPHVVAVGSRGGGGRDAVHVEGARVAAEEATGRRGGAVVEKADVGVVRVVVRVVVLRVVRVIGVVPDGLLNLGGHLAVARLDTVLLHRERPVDLRVCGRSEGGYYFAVVEIVILRSRNQNRLLRAFMQKWQRRLNCMGHKPQVRSQKSLFIT